MPWCFQDMARGACLYTRTKGIAARDSDKSGVASKRFYDRPIHTADQRLKAFVNEMTKKNDAGDETV